MERTRDEHPQGRGPVPVPHLDPLPFRLVELSDRQLDYVTTLLERWNEVHGLVRSSTIKAVRVFTQYCSPADARAVGLALIAEYQMWFFATNDMPDGAEKLSTLAEMRLILQGHPARDSGLLKATSALRSLILKTVEEVKTERLFHFLDQLLAALIWEVERAGGTPSVALYRENRQHTIATHPYLELFRLAEDVQPAEAVWPSLSALQERGVEMIYLTNDILSVKRDLQKNSYNLVLGLARERDITYEDAMSQVMSLLKHAADEVGAAQDELLRNKALDERTRRYVDFLGSIIEGNRMATAVLAERYAGKG